MENNKNILQFVRHNEVFATKEEAKNYIESKNYGEGYQNRPSHYGEPIVLKYGDETDPKLLLGIGLVDSGENFSIAKTFWIDIADIDSQIKDLKDRLDLVEGDVEMLKELVSNIIESCGLDDNGEFVLPEDFLDEDCTSIKECLKALSDYILMLEKKVNLTPKETDTIITTVEEAESGRTIYSDVKLPKKVLIDEKTYTNQIIVSGLTDDKGIFHNVELAYSGNGDTLKLIVNGQIVGEYNIPTEAHVEKGHYRTKDETLVLKLSNGEKVEVDLHKLASEIRVDENSSTPVQLKMDRVLDSHKDSFGDEVYHSVISADVYIAKNNPSNILETSPIDVVDASGKTRPVNALFVKGTADNIKYKGTTVEGALDTINGEGEGSIKNAVSDEKLRAEGVENDLRNKLNSLSGSLGTTNINLAKEVEDRTNDVNDLKNEDLKLHNDDEYLSGQIIANRTEIQNVDKRRTLKQPLSHSNSIGYSIRETVDGTEIDSWVLVDETVSNNLIKGGKVSNGGALFATVDLELYKGNKLVFRTSANTGGTTYQLPIAELSYDEVKNCLKWKTNSGGTDYQEIKLADHASLIHDIYYDSKTESIVIEYKTYDSEATKKTEIPVHDLIQEWTTGETTTVKLTKDIVSGSGPDILSAEVKIASNDDNIVEKKADGIYVSKNDIHKYVDDEIKNHTLSGSSTIDIKGNIVSVKVCEHTDVNKYLKVHGTDGLAVEGVDEAISDAIEALRGDSDTKYATKVEREQGDADTLSSAKTYTDDEIAKIEPRVKANEDAIKLLNEGDEISGSVKYTVMNGLNSIKLSDSDTIKVNYVEKKAEVKVHDDALNKYLEKDTNGLYVGAKVDEAILKATSGLDATLLTSVKDVNLNQHTDNPLLYDITYHLNNNTLYTAGTINIPKDKFLKEVKYEKPNLTLVFVTESGEKTVNVDLKDLIDIYSAGDGLQLDSNKFSIKINKDEKYLEVTADGLRTKGIDNVIKTAVDTEANIRNGETQFLSGKVETLIDTKQNKLEEGDAIKIVGDIIDVKLDGGHNEDYLQIHSGGLCLTGIDAIKTSVNTLSGEVATISGDVKDEAINSAKTYTDQQMQEKALSGSSTISIQDKVVKVKYHSSDEYLKSDDNGLYTSGITEGLNTKADKDNVYTKSEIDNLVTYSGSNTIDLIYNKDEKVLTSKLKISKINRNAIQEDAAGGVFVGCGELTYETGLNQLTFTDTSGNTSTIQLNSIQTITSIYFDGATDELVFQYMVDGKVEEFTVDAAAFFKGIIGTRTDSYGHHTNIEVTTALTITSTTSTSTMTGISANLDVNDIIDNTNSTVTLKKDATQNKIFANVNIAEIPNNILKIDSGTSNNSLYVLGTAENINYEGTKNVKTKIQELEASAITNTTNITILSGDVKDLKTESDKLYKAVGVDKGDSSITTQMAGTNYLGGQTNVTNALRKLDELLKESSDGLAKEIQDRKDGDEYISGVVDNLQSDIDVEDTDTIDLTIDSNTVKSGNKTILKADVKLSTSTDTSYDDGTVVNLIKAKDDGLFFNGSIDYGTF